MLFVFAICKILYKKTGSNTANKNFMTALFMWTFICRHGYILSRRNLSLDFCIWSL